MIGTALKKCPCKRDPFLLKKNCQALQFCKGEACKMAFANVHVRTPLNPEVSFWRELKCDLLKIENRGGAKPQHAATRTKIFSQKYSVPPFYTHVLKQYLICTKLRHNCIKKWAFEKQRNTAGDEKTAFIDTFTDAANVAGGGREMLLIFLWNSVQEKRSEETRAFCEVVTNVEQTHESETLDRKEGVNHELLPHSIHARF